MKPFPASSLKARISGLVGLLFLLAIVAITLLVTEQLRDEMRAQLSQQQLATATHLAKDIDGKLRLRLESLQRVASSLPTDLLSQPGQLQGWLDERRTIHPLFPNGLLVIPANGGSALADSIKLASRPRSFADRDWFAEVSTSRRPVISRPLYTRASGEAALVMAIPVLNRHGEIRAVVAGVIPLAAPGFLNALVGASPAKDARYQLLSAKHGLWVMSSDQHDSVTALPRDGSDPAVDLAVAGQRGSQLVRLASGEHELVSLVDIPQSGWSLLARQPASTALAAVDNLRLNALLLALLFSLPLLAGLLIGLDRLLRPLGVLASALQEMASGQRPLQAIALGNGDEVARVADSFNQLQQKLLAQEKRLADIAHHDPLTGLPNRLAIRDRMNLEIRRCRRQNSGLALLFLDLDGFKAVNDRHGHQLGDLLLFEVGQRLRLCIRDCDLLARLGGDEFLILLSDTGSPLDAGQRAAQRCIDALTLPFPIQGENLQIGVSIGIACIEPGSEPSDLLADTLIAQADRAMYCAKGAGRNRYTFHNDNTSPT